jgi:hypothetical protein
MKKWEYRVENDANDEVDIDKLGLDGWELVTIVSKLIPMGLHNETVYFYFFKRELLEAK